MKWQLIRLEDVVASAWRNGGGMTREMAAWPSAGEWWWRISVAEVAAGGPFSRFEGVQRWFAVLNGSGVKLKLGSGEHLLTSSSEPFCFDGAQSLDCRLVGGATQDLNLMVRSDKASAKMMRVRGERVFMSARDAVFAIYCNRTAGSVHSDNETVSVPANSLVWRPVAAGTQVRINAEDALWMEIAPWA